MRILKLLIAASVLLSLSNCAKEAEIQTKDYPFVITNSPTVNNEGVEFSADLTNLGNLEILKYGFVWSEESNPTILENSKLLETEPEKGIFSCIIKGGLIKGNTYYVRAYILTNQYEVYGNQKPFISQGSLPPVIETFTPDSGPIGTRVVILGENFALSKAGNIVKFGDVEANVDSVSADRLVVTVPKITKSEKVRVTIETAGIEVKSQESFDLLFPWLKKTDFSSVSNNSASFSIANTGYVINPNSTDMLTYEPIEDKWQNNITLPENSGDLPLAYSLNEVAYVLLQDDFWKYNSISNNWVKMEEFPGILQDDRRYIFGINIGNNIYIGNCYNNYDFWEYNTTQDSWQRKADFIGNFNQMNPVWGNYSFSINNKGFLGVSQTGSAINTLWEYDPIQNVWFGKLPLPSDAYSHYCSFVIDEVAYVGLGENPIWGNGYVSNEIWEYDYQNDIWIKYHDCPVRMAVYASFGINNKGYIVSGFTEYNHDLDNVWEFDPLKN